ncbi:hypothetical protein LIER_31803 [Lithospermum erythrorhizon]|uniref:F-box protein n=1 Tax=Lithospermum erythrorhizon TaxID=34254 RepID=A0AAV3RV55_LITER
MVSCSWQKMAKCHRHVNGGLISPAEKVLGNEDLLYEILLLVASKSLLRHQCVSRQWGSLISDPCFVRLHTQKVTSVASSAIFLVGECTKSPIYLSKMENEYQIVETNPLDMEEKLLNRAKSGLFIRHSCNGLICIACPVDKLYSIESFWCQVYNPCSRCFASNPRPCSNQVSGYLAAMNLAFNPLESDHFKIIGIWEDMIKFSFFIYSSKTNSWKDTGVSLDARYYTYNFGDYGESQYFFRNGVFLNGNLHWVSNTKSFLCFDTIGVRFEPMPCTPVSSDGRNIRYFGAYGGRLHLIENKHNQAMIFNVMEMRNDYSEWYVKSKVDINFVTKIYPRVMGEYGYLNILSLMWVKDEQQKMKLMLSVPGKIISCDVDEETVTELFDVQPERSYYKSYHVYDHFESLFKF